MKTIAFIVFLFLILIISLPTKAAASSPPDLSSVTVEEVRQFINEYTTRFMKSDLDAFMALFLRDATENRMIPYADIREAYRKTILYSNSITYNLRVYSIQTYKRSAFVTGRYEIIQALKRGGRQRVLRGDIQWDLVRENGSLKIREVNYGRDKAR